MKCCFCGKEAGSIEQAIELGWYPDFWVGHTNYQGPVCAECQSEHLVADESGEYVLKSGHPLPRTAVFLGHVGIKKEIRMPHLLVRPKFQLGQLLATPGALKAMEEAGQSPAFFLEKHMNGDWGEVCQEDKLANDQALLDGGRLLSAYKTLKGERLWIITEATDDQGRRAASTLLLPSEY
jgi:hypothetical protein